MQDKLFETPEKMPRFEFNQAVTDVFDDMINRSVPFYQHILQQVAQLVGQNARIYDLGCSTGALVPFLKRRYSNFNYVGIDKSRTMIEKAQQHAGNHIQFLEGDLIQNYMQALDKGGKLIIVEKVRQKNEALQKIYKESYHELKRTNGYSQVEINHKDHALDGILVSETSEFYWNAVSGATTTDAFFKWYNFEGIVAIK
jgi:tRNA (cmo5U34)-methyltransferase